MILKHFDSISQRAECKSHRHTNIQVVPWNNLMLHTLDSVTKNKKIVPIGKGLLRFLTEIREGQIYLESYVTS
jgi:hypothetical protein